MRRKKEIKYYLMTVEKIEVPELDRDIHGDLDQLWKTVYDRRFHGIRDTLKEAKDWAASLVLKSGEHPYAVKGTEIHFTIEEKTKTTRKAKVRKDRRN